jgi:quercetin dioxygenase-like cupin family protein
MKDLFLVLALLFSASLLAQAPEPVPLAHGNTPGEPHHHLKIENEYVRVYYVEVPPHENTQLHQHDHDYLFVTLGDSDVINAVRDKPEVHLVLKDGETHFTRGGFAHVARNLSDKPFRNVTIELLKPQTEPRNQCERVIADLPVRDCNKPDDFSKLPPNSPLKSFAKAMLRPRAMFETGEVEMTSYSSSIKESYSDDSKSARLVIVDAGSDLEVDVIGNPSKSLRGGEVMWLKAEKKWKVTTPGHRVTHFVMIQFKDSAITKQP